MTEAELTSLLFKLADIGITGIKAHYDGQGDSGTIETILYTTTPCETPEDVDENVEWDSADIKDTDISGIYSLLEDFFYEILNNIEDWWNDDGGYGDISICIPSGKYIIDNHVRYYETSDYQHTGSLIDQTKE